MRDIIETLHVNPVRAERSVLDRGWRGGRHCLPKARLYLILGGGGRITCDESDTTLLPGWLYLVPENLPLSYSCDETLKLFWAHFHARVFDVIDLFSIWNPGILSRRVDQMENDAMRNVVRYFPGRGLADAILCRAELLRLLALFIGDTTVACCKRKTIGDIKRFQKVIRLVEEDPGHSWSISELSAQVGMGRVRFTTEFKRVFGSAPCEFIRRKRIERGTVLLLDPSKKLDAVAGETGFYDGFHFSKVFKRVTGVSPRKFRADKSADLP